MYIDVRQVKEGFRKKMEGFLLKEVKRAELARIVQTKVSHPPNSKFKQMVGSPRFKNCAVNAKDVSNSRAIYGPNLPGLAGRPTRKKLK